MYVYLFEEGNTRLRNLLGGKGADLAEMTALGLPVPPGMTITTEACNYYSSKHEFPASLEEEVKRKMSVLEQKTGKQFGDEENPLLVSVRSGAPISMPGMMDTVLNLGLNDRTVEGVVRQTKDRRFAYDAYRRFIQMFGKVVLGARAEHFEAIISNHKAKRHVTSDVELDADALAEIVTEFKRLVKEETQSTFPEEPFTQLKMAIAAVFQSWNGRSAVVYLQAKKIPDTLGTAVNIQTMVF